MMELSVLTLSPRSGIDLLDAMAMKHDAVDLTIDRSETTGQDRGSIRLEVQARPREDLRYYTHYGAHVVLRVDGTWALEIDLPNTVTPGEDNEVG